MLYNYLGVSPPCPRKSTKQRLCVEGKMRKTFRVMTLSYGLLRTVVKTPQVEARVVSDILHS